MNRAGHAHFFQPLLERLTTAMKPDGDIVQTDTKARRHAVAGFFQQVYAPDHFGIFRLESWQELVKTIADRLFELIIRLDRQFLEIEGIHDFLPFTPFAGSTLVINDCRGENAAEPATNAAHIAQVSRPLDSAEHEHLQDLLGLIPAAQSPAKKTQNLPMAFDERTANCSIRCPGGDVRIIIRQGVVMRQCASPAIIDAVA